MKSPRRSRRITIALGAVSIAVLMTAGAATAAKKITGDQIARGAVESVQVKNGSLTPADLNSAARSGGFVPVVGNDDSVAQGAVASVTLSCPAGKAYAGGGGWFYVDTDADNTFDAGETIVDDAQINGIIWNNAASVEIRATHNVVGAQGDFFGWIHCATA